MYSNILVALDGSDTSTRALGLALRLARENHAQLHPVYVIDVPLIAYDTPGFDPAIVRDAYREEGERVIEAARDRMAKLAVTGSPRIVEAVAPGEDVAHRIQLAAAECRADLIVMGTHGRRGFRRLVLGSVAERVLRVASCPVLLMPAQARNQNVDEAEQSAAEKELS
ncbi:universal stress protein [Paraburkholderia rhizosphaerae]|uniref:Nucleotide-binding universal stress UspA family protein n=1 Tax=Paraburkholderia rhizosphaerae TaxID=480658 RepID=A0A4R8LTX4_9BURK|nr:universal stress protein [Paraburkholderia rhizosphaerae]TDY50968.1 nucleotide-binding universal stress UspA family protein [Paraburkholderia rhizosphaerae]